VGVGTGVGQVNAAARDLRLRLDGAAQRVGEAITLATDAGTRASLSEGIATLIPAGERVAVAHDGIRATTAAVVEVQRLAGRVLQGRSSEAVARGRQIGEAGDAPSP